MKELKTTREVLQALLDGVEVESKLTIGDVWVTLNSLCLNVEQMDANTSGEFRVKPTKPSIDWSHVHPDYRYLARDECGLVCLFKDKPHKDVGVWVCSSGVANASAFLTLKPGNCDWTESLVERPQE